MKKIVTPFLLAALCALSGCDTGIRQMGATESGVVFRRLPTFLGGGVSHKVIPQAQKVIIWPWDELFRFDTAERYVTWRTESNTVGSNTPPAQQVVEPRGQKSTSGDKGYLYTRALDGNEVALSVTVVYRVQTEPSKLVTLLQEGAANDSDVRTLVEAIGRADIRTFMNHLRTAEFADAGARYRAVAEVQRSMNKRLDPYGIEIVRVTLDDFQFERLLRDGSVDSSYQEKLTQIQKLNEDTNREVSRIQTVKAKKEKELNDVQGEVNRIKQEAEGFKDQAKLRSDAYFQEKKNQADSILATGKAEVEGLIQQVQAFSGPGGAALLKLEIVRQLLKSNPKFVVLNEGGKEGSNLGVRRLDVNQLLSQIGVIEALKEPVNPKSTEAADEPTK